MFCFCSDLERVNLSSFKAFKIENMSGMFFFCSQLKEVNLENYEFSERINVKEMFVNNPENINILSGNKEIPRDAFEF